MSSYLNYNSKLSQVNSKLTWGGYLLVSSSKTTFFHSAKIME